MNENPPENGDESPLQASDDAQAREEIMAILEQHQKRYAQLPEDCDPTDRARIQLDIAEALHGLDNNADAWAFARTALDTFLKQELWQDAVESCDILYQTDQQQSIAALGQGVWLAITYPVKPQTSISMLHHIIDETPVDSDGAAIAATTAHYIADMRSEEKERESLTFLTTQLLAQVAKRHRGIEDQEALNIWMEMLQLNDPAEFLPRMATIIDVIVGDNWWFDRDELRKQLPVN